MKKYIIRTIKITSFLVVFALALLFLQNFVLCHIDHNKLRIDGFYLEDEKSIDVVFTGASELYAGFCPALAFEKFGFKREQIGDHLATHGNCIAASIPMLFHDLLSTGNPSPNHLFSSSRKDKDWQKTPPPTE